MKKILSFILSMTLLCGCSATENNTANDETLTENTTLSVSEDTTEQRDSVDDVTEVNGEKILIAYFSQSGNTRKIAEEINSQMSGDIFEIKTSTPYPEDYNTLIDVAKKEQEENVRPELSTHIENIEEYDVIFLGYPNWWSDLPMPVFTFLDEYNLEGKTIIPFCTHGGGGFANGIESMKTEEPNANFIEGIAINGSSVDNSGDEISEWLNGLGL